MRGWAHPAFPNSGILLPYGRTMWVSFLGASSSPHGQIELPRPLKTQKIGFPTPGAGIAKLGEGEEAEEKIEASCGPDSFHAVPIMCMHSVDMNGAPTKYQAVWRVLGASG